MLFGLLTSPVARTDIPLIQIPTRQKGRLCTDCQNFDIQSFYKDPYYNRGYSFRDAKRAAQHGCSFCSLMVDAFRTGPISSVNRPWHRRDSDIETWWLHFHLTLQSVILDQQSQTRGDAITLLTATLAPKNALLPYSRLPWHRETFVSKQFHVIADPGSVAYESAAIRGRYVGENVRSQDHVSFIRSWLQSCLEHPACNHTLSGIESIQSTHATLPSRCIDVTQENYRLVDCSSQTGSYIALSHRWTENTFHCRTTTKNIDARLAGDDDAFGTLPGTFHDILQLSRKLGVQYVWIDSLCIIQHGDEGRDWKAEAIKMGSYYQKALLTIAASSCESKDATLFPGRTISAPRLARLPYRDEMGLQQGHFYVSNYDSVLDDHYRQYVQESELLSRGWVLQEWLLSRRIVYFTPAGIIFECAANGPSNERGESVPSEYDNVWATDRPLSKTAFPFHQDFVEDLWYRIVQSYSALTLTMAEQDRIIALSGIAIEYRNLVKKLGAMEVSVSGTVNCSTEYVAGLWLRDFHRGLLWEAVPKGNDIGRIIGYPTWSWASVSSSVSWHDTNEGAEKEYPIPIARIVEVVSAEEECMTLSALTNNPSSITAEPNLNFDVDNRYAALTLMSKMQPVLIRDKISREEDIKLVREMMGPRDARHTQLWRKVCSLQAPTEAIGWASIEDPECQSESFYDVDGLELNALVVSTRTSSYSYGLGRLLPFVDIYMVIFVMHTGDGRFRRVGVGRVFGQHVHQGFGDSVAEQKITLI